VLIVGFGFIGKGLVEEFFKKSKLIQKTDKDFKLVGVSDSNGYIFRDEGFDIEELLNLKKLSLSNDYRSNLSCMELVEKSDADLMIESTPTNIDNGEPGLSYIRQALKKGIHVVTPNKGPLVVAFRELMSLANKNESKLLYEGTVAGAIPIFSLIQKCLQGDKVTKISGILNGTTNYILSKMYFEGTSFDLALKEAQERGITEKNPSYDIDGVDAACKVLILANTIMGKNIKFDDIERTGIRDVTQEAISLARKSNLAIKLVGTVNDTFEVAPKLIPINHPLCIHGTLNAIHLETDIAKQITLVGYGAGKETVSAVLNDVFTILKNN
jgi:homoserine dehydrogenase